MRHFVAVPQNDDSGPKWYGGTPAEQGYNVLPLPNLRRSEAKDNEYYVYSNATEFKAVEADSAVSAIAASELEVAHKVVHAHTRLEDVINVKKLEYSGKNTAYMEKHGFTQKPEAAEPVMTETPVAQSQSTPAAEPATAPPASEPPPAAD